jgi:hypothetical protein
MYIASLGTYNVEKWKKFLELKFCPVEILYTHLLDLIAAKNATICPCQELNL